MKDIMTDELKSLIHQLSKQTDKDKKIRGILLCKDKSGMIVASKVSIGDEFKLPFRELNTRVEEESDKYYNRTEIKIKRGMNYDRKIR